MSSPTLYVVHTIDTEGPLAEDLSATFQRLEDLFGLRLEASARILEQLQRQELPLDGLESEVAAVVSPQLLAYNCSWADIHAMLEDCRSEGFRREMVDDFGGGWVYSWHCVDHLGFTENPRGKDLGYGKIFRAYRSILADGGDSRDEINWHFHPLSLTRNPLHAATSYYNSMDVLLPLLARRVIDDRWFPTTSRPGFHAERPDAHAFMEQWIPFDYSNQACEETDLAQSDTKMGRFGDWSRAPRTWQGYHPHHDDYQVPGDCRRWIYRCLNLGTRFRLLTKDDVRQAFTEARASGIAILSFADHDYRDIRPDVNCLRGMLTEIRAEFPDVRIRFAGAEEAARNYVAEVEPESAGDPPILDAELRDDRIQVVLKDGTIFGPQPFLALKTKDGRYLHDNLDVIHPGRHWTYVLDDQTLPGEAVDAIGVGAAGISGGYGVATLRVSGQEV